MQGLLVQALALRQLGRLKPRQLLPPGYEFKQTGWCPRTVHTRQLWGPSALCALGPHRAAVRGRDPVCSWSLHQLRFKSSKKKGSTPKATLEEDEDKRDLEDSDYEDEEDEEEDPNLPKDYKNLKTFVRSFRYDIIMKAGLYMTRNKVEDAFYSNQLWLNGQKLIKKSKSVKAGDTLDMVLSKNKETNTVVLTRVVVKKVLGKSKDGDKYKVALRCWDCLEVPKEEAFKP